MLLPVSVSNDTSTITPPTPDVSILIEEDGYKLSSGVLKIGKNIIKVQFNSSIRYPSFVGQDIHLVKIQDNGDLEKAKTWLDWQTPNGLLTPSPVTFLGGLESLPAGQTGYLEVELSKGKYAFIGEVPDAREKGMLMEFTIE